MGDFYWHLHNAYGADMAKRATISQAEVGSSCFYFQAPARFLKAQSPVNQWKPIIHTMDSEEVPD